MAACAHAGDGFAVDAGFEFLSKLASLGAGAEKVYAVSADRACGYWLKPEAMAAARQYLERQPLGTIRLFVFETPESAHAHMEVLEAHHRRYGRTGAVLLCSRRGYARMLELLPCQAPGLLDGDLSLWTSSGHRTMALSDGSRVRVSLRRIDGPAHESGADASVYQRLTALLSELAQATPGEMRRVHQDSFQVLRWNSRFMDDRSQWADGLSLLFGTPETPPSPDLYHLVFLRGGIPEAVISSIRQRLLDARARSELGFEDLWVGKRVNLQVSDGLYRGQLNTGPAQEQGHALIFHFKDETQLRKYYSEARHSLIRRTLYEAFSPEIAGLYRQLDEIRAADGDPAPLYARIEALAAPFMQRMDFISGTLLQDLAATPPARFPYEHFQGAAGRSVTNRPAPPPPPPAAPARSRRA